MTETSIIAKYLCERPKRVVMLVDDDEMFLKMADTAMAGMGCEVVCASSGDMAIDLMKTIRPDVVITDLNMPGTDGIGVGDYVRKHLPGTTVMICSGDSALLNEVVSKKYMILPKPVSIDDLAAIGQKFGRR